MASGRPACPLCRERRGKRLCPAKGAEICAHCCGTKRRVEIDCPSDCAYLSGIHASGWEGRETERRRDARRLAPFLQELSEVQARLFFLALAGIGAMRARRRDLDDRLLGQAVSALRKTAETRARGVLYDHQADDARAQGLVVEVRQLFEAQDESGRAVSPEDRDLLAVLVALDRSIAATLGESEGSVAFLDTALRLVGRLEGAPATVPRPLIVEP
ncbi:MAG: hypothetical protein ACHQNV_00795 [Vicinamibacteria bacterium]